MEKSATPREELKIIGNTTGYIYDISVNVTFDCIRNTKSFKHLSNASIATIVANIIHKYNKWSVAGKNIMINLIHETNQQYNSGHYKWESQMSVKGCYYGNEVFQDLPTVYDCLSFVGFLKPQEIEVDKTYSMFLNYNVTFFLSPALDVTLSYYQSKGYSFRRPIVDKVLDFQKVCDTLNYDSSFDHQKVWETALLESTTI